MTEPNPPHDYDDPRQFLNALEWAVYNATTTLCIHCDAKGHLLPMSGTTWGPDITHEDGCPAIEDELS